MKSSFKKGYQLGIFMLVSTSLMACSALNYSSFTELVPSFSPSPSPSPLDAATLLVCILVSDCHLDYYRFRLLLLLWYFMLYSWICCMFGLVKNGYF